MTKDNDEKNHEKDIIYSQERQVANFRQIMRLVTISFIAFAVIMVIFAGITISNLITAELNQERITSLETNFEKLYKIFIGTLEEYKPDRERQNDSRTIIYENNELLKEMNQTINALK